MSKPIILRALHYSDYSMWQSTCSSKMTVFCRVSLSSEQTFQNFILSLKLISLTRNQATY